MKVLPHVPWLHMACPMVSWHAVNDGGGVEHTLPQAPQLCRSLIEMQTPLHRLSPAAHVGVAVHAPGAVPPTTPLGGAQAQPFAVHDGAHEPPEPPVP